MKKYAMLYRAVPSQELLAESGCTLYNDVIVQIDDFLVLTDEQREIKSNEVQLLKTRETGGLRHVVPTSQFWLAQVWTGIRRLK